ncbi:hypothetical protein [Nitratireductor rhodophyticola]|uniref:hypothetical protein n=1 Tax=Nitratireductor rhodophyticola TaxID=2854036 RepID=UPI003008DADF
MAAGVQVRMVRVDTALLELRQIVESGRDPNEPRCRRLLLRATSAIPDLTLAAQLSDRVGVLISTLGMVEALGSDRGNYVAFILSVLDEIEEASLPH